MNVLSLFDGMSCGQLALKNLGVKVNKFYASEIDKFAINVTQENFPNTIQLGDVTQVDGTSLDTIDLLIGGSPCQGFSFAGKNLNFEDPRSKLFFEFIRLLKECKPKYFLLENVKMKKESEAIITELLGVEPIEINSRLLSAQNRKRLYWTNIPNLTQPKDLGITWGMVREHGVSIDKFYYTEKAMQWLAKQSQLKNRVLNVHSFEDKMQMLEASHSKKYSSQRFFGILDIPTELEAVGRLVNRRIKNLKRADNDKTIPLKPYIEFKYDAKTNCLTTVRKDNVVIPFTLPHRVPSDEMMFRYITPLECERLQTVPDGYTSVASDTQRYRMLGNGWTVKVIVHILKGIL